MGGDDNSCASLVAEGEEGNRRIASDNTDDMALMMM